ncbi:MAG: hypothetical protein ACJ8AG_11825 [Ktedonobacteraceae bacterium]
MKDKLINWWQRYRKPTVITAIIVLLAIGLIVVGYQIDATGSNGSHTLTIATSYSGTSSTTVTRTEVEVPSKSFWDCLLNCRTGKQRQFIMHLKPVAWNAPVVERDGYIPGHGPIDDRPVVTG